MIEAVNEEGELLYGESHVMCNLFKLEALEKIADISLARKTGARGLRAIMENVMMDTMYHVPSDESIKTCLITKDAVLGKPKPVYNSNAVATQSA